MATGPRLSINCPHCGSKAVVRSSRSSSLTTKELFLQCSNLLCGATYGAVMEILHAIAPSATPNPDVVLRIAPPRRRAANDDQPLPANDDTGPCGPEVPLPNRTANDNHAASAAAAGGS